MVSRGEGVGWKTKDTCGAMRHCRRVFEYSISNAEAFLKNDCYCIRPKSKKMAKPWWYAIAVFLKMLFFHIAVLS